jgi:hypothetical protein
MPNETSQFFVCPRKHCEAILRRPAHIIDTNARFDNVHNSRNQSASHSSGIGTVDNHSSHDSANSNASGHERFREIRPEESHRRRSRNHQHHVSSSTDTYNYLDVSPQPVRKSRSKKWSKCGHEAQNQSFNPAVEFNDDTVHDDENSHHNLELCMPAVVDKVDNRSNS